MKDKEKESDKASSGLPEMPNLPPMPLSANMSNEASTAIIIQSDIGLGL